MQHYVRSKVIDERERKMPGKRKYKCKRLKGDHKYEQKEVKFFPWSKSTVKVMVCEACGKREWLWNQ